VDDTARDLLVRGMAAAKANSNDEARFFLEKYLRQGVGPQEQVQAWRYLAQIAAEPEEKRRYIASILAVDPTDGFARRELAVLDGSLDPRDIVNPEHEPRSTLSAESVQVEAERLSCARCGSSRVGFSPDGQTLVCEHCHYETPVGAPSGAQPRARDFAATIWTSKGRATPERSGAMTCTGCGASFLLAPGILSLTCPHCAAVHLVDGPELRDLIPPDAIIPFIVDRNAAEEALARLRRDQDITPTFGVVSGLYVPVWMFTFAGEAQWSGVERERLSLDSRHPVPVSGSLTVIDRHALVPATPTVPDRLIDLLNDFDLGTLVPYDARYLADFPSEMYQVSLDEASIPARRIALAAIKESAKDELDGVDDLEIKCPMVGIDAFKLLLLPLWMTRFDSPDAPQVAAVNGQTGRAATVLPPRGFLNKLRQLFGGDS
jgi:hypothetical protein